MASGIDFIEYFNTFPFEYPVIVKIARCSLFMIQPRRFRLWMRNGNYILVRGRRAQRILRLRILAGNAAIDDISYIFICISAKLSELFFKFPAPENSYESFDKIKL